MSNEEKLRNLFLFLFVKKTCMPLCQLPHFGNRVTCAPRTGHNNGVTVILTFQPDYFSIIHPNYRPPVMIVTHLCANFIIGPIYMNDSPFIKVGQFNRADGGFSLSEYTASSVTL